MSLVKKGETRFLLKRVFSRINSEKSAYVLKLDTTKPIKKVRAFVDISLRILKQEDNVFFKEDDDNIALINQLKDGYVAVTKDGNPCFRVWVMDSSQNAKIQQFFKSSYPILKQDEVLMESAFAIPKYRGLGVMPLAVSEIATLFKSKGKNTIITIAPTDNINSIKALYYLGFKPQGIRTERFFMFRKSVTFEDISPILYERFNTIVKPRKRQPK